MRTPAFRTSASRTTGSRASVPADESARACYVYGIVAADAPEPEDVLGVGDPPSTVTLARYRDLAALVSDIAVDRPLGAARDLRSHAEVLDTMAERRITVLPLRFGSVVSTSEAVGDELLAPHEWTFLRALRDLAGWAQFTVRGRYQQDRLLREVLAGRSDIAELRDQVGAMTQDAGYYQRIQLGELIAGAVADRREEDSRVLLDRLGPLAGASNSAEPGGSPDELNASFLVRHDARSAFENAAEELARSWAGRIDLRMLGPLAPYDFVAETIESIEAAEGGR